MDRGRTSSQNQVKLFRNVGIGLGVLLVILLGDIIFTNVNNADERSVAVNAQKSSDQAYYSNRDVYEFYNNCKVNSSWMGRVNFDLKNPYHHYQGVGSPLPDRPKTMMPYPHYGVDISPDSMSGVRINFGTNSGQITSVMVGYAPNGLSTPDQYYTIPFVVPKNSIEDFHDDSWNFDPINWEIPDGNHIAQLSICWA